MIPLRIQLKNFLSYGALQTIDFAPYHLICLSGKNGHGKSALLDAITWALWGQARKITASSKPDQGLIRLGQTSMRVIFDFMFNGTTYRVMREFGIYNGKPYPVLEFGIVDPASDNCIPLTDKTVRATQAQIETILRLDYDSFINSAFLRQGQSNEFSKKTPKERKEILASILGLTQFETLRKLALERIRDAVQHQKSIELVITTLQQQIATKSAIIEQKKAAQEILEHLTSSIYTLENEQRTIDQQKQILLLQEQEQSINLQQLNVAQQSWDTSHAKLQELRTHWRQLLSLSPATTRDYLLHQKQLLVIRLTQLQEVYAQHLAHKEQLLAAHTVREQRRYALDVHRQQQLNHHTILYERAHAACEHITQKLHNITEEIAILEKSLHELMAQQMLLQEQVHTKTQLSEQTRMLEHTFERKKQYYHHWVAHLSFLQKELHTAAQREQLFAQEQNPSCPLCEQNVSASRKRFLRTQFMRIGHIKHHQSARLKRILPHIKEQLMNMHTTLTSYTEQTAQNIAQEQMLDTLIKEINHKTEQCTKLHLLHTETELAQKQALQAVATHQHELEQVQQTSSTYTRDAEYIGLDEQYTRIQQYLASHPYDQHAYLSTQQELSSIEQQLTSCENLPPRAIQKQRILDGVAHVCADLKQIQVTLCTIKKQLEKYHNMEHQRASLSTHEEQVLQTTHHTRTELQTVHARIAQHEHALDHIACIEEQIQNHTTQINDLNAVIDDYTHIACASSKDGIQALLIEEAIPEIEHEANNVLSKLTNNQAHLMIESLRDLKKGGVKETLDIKISDPNGVRPYELFSGGEAFRIDFALRVAISKLLARRAGTALQTLIIDEGFGSQDEEGLSHIMDVLYKVQDDFAKIIIVSHLHSMKDQFPVHFVIEKYPDGSRIQVVEQG